MDDHNRTGPPNHTGSLAEADIVDQLRHYADALAEQRGPDSGDPLIDPRAATPDRSRRPRILALVAAIAAVLIGGGALVRATVGDRSSSVESTEDPTTSDGTDPEPDRDLPIEAGGPLLPDPARWLVTEAYPPQTSTPGGHGVWAWRLDGHTYVLIDGASVDPQGPRESASARVEGDRAVMTWSEDGRPISFQGYGVDEETLRSVAATAAWSPAGGWTVPEAEVLAARANGEGGSVESVQVGFSPVTPAGAADLSITVTGVLSRGTAADLFGGLHEASSLGPVLDHSVDGGVGYLMTGPFLSYALIERDGWVWSLSTSTPDVDLTDLLDHLQPGTEEAWEAAVAAADDNMARALEAAVAEMGESAGDAATGGTTTDDGPDLPRYLLPDPWTIELVTDAGLWSTEERAQRAALEAAHAPPGGFGQPIVTQGFGRADPADRQIEGLPFALPEATVRVYRWETDRPADGFDAMPGESQQITVAGLDGTILPMDFADGRTEFVISVRQGQHSLDIETGWDRPTVDRFVESLTLAGGDIGGGVVSTSDEFASLVQVDGQAGNLFDFYRRWSAAFRAPEGGRVSQATVSVDELSFDQFQLWLARYNPLGRSAFEAIDGGAYLVRSHQRFEPVDPGDDYADMMMVSSDGTDEVEWIPIDADGNPIPGLELEAVSQVQLVRYDPATGLLVELSVPGDVADAIALLESLAPVDLDSWRELVTPYNATPRGR